MVGVSVAVAAYVWPRKAPGPDVSDATLTVEVRAFKTFGAYRVAAAPGCASDSAAQNCTRYPPDVLADGPLLGLWARVEDLVGYEDEELTWHWTVFDHENTPANSEPPSWEYKVVSDKDQDSLDLQPAPIYPPPEGGTFYVNVTLWDSPGHQLAHACSAYVTVSPAGAPFKATYGDSDPCPASS